MSTGINGILGTAHIICSVIDPNYFVAIDTIIDEMNGAALLI
jgi:hypothetical protein